MQLCMRKVDTKAVITVRIKLPSFSAVGILKIFIFAKSLNLYWQGKPCRLFLLFLAQKKKQKDIHPPQGPSLYGGDATQKTAETDGFLPFW